MQTLLEYHSMYVCKSKRGMKRDDSKEAYKLPHRLIEKKRRDRINECISQLKDLLPEHLKLTTLGHLEKAVVLELALKHLKALTTLTEQQHQKIIALQNGDRTLKVPVQSDLDAFHSGFQTCAREVLQHLTRFESWSPREQRCAQLIGHLHRASTQLRADKEAPAPSEGPAGARAKDSHGGENCVPVIQRTQVAEHNGSDTDTDSGYGGDGERCEGKSEKEFNPGGGACHESRTVKIKQEPDDPPAKRVKVDLAGQMTSSDSGRDSALHSMMGIGTLPTLGQQAPFCLPFYIISPSAAAPYMPLLDKASLEKYWYPAPIPVLYPSIPGLHGISALAPDRLLCRVPSPGSGTAPALVPSGPEATRHLGAERPPSSAPDPLQSPNNTS
ncbi:class E basic helix-loop-helix protein 41 isoform X2 [Heptranchias perlo]|uniref:class E basic helix-loop-helix protein 41 isoform X2 n=1 Tax=Heptranchias perlo TaxID=212740 RepID=UPI00355A7B89